MNSEEQVILDLFTQYEKNFVVDETRTWNEQSITPFYAEPAMMVADQHGPIPLPNHGVVSAVYKAIIDPLIPDNFARTESPMITVKQLGKTTAIAHELNIRYRQDGSEMGRFGTTYILGKQNDQWKIMVNAVHGADAELASVHETKRAENKEGAAAFLTGEEQAIIERLIQYEENFVVDETRTWNEQSITPFYTEPAMMVADQRGPIPLPNRGVLGAVYKAIISPLIPDNFARTATLMMTVKQLGKTTAIVHTLNIRYRQDGSEMTRFGVTYIMSKQEGQWKIAISTIHDPDPELASLYETKRDETKEMTTSEETKEVTAARYKSFLQQIQEATKSAPDPRAAAKTKLQLVGKWISISPIEFFNELRENSPIYATPAFTLVTRYEDVREATTLNHIFTTDLLKQNVQKFIGNTVVVLPPSPEYEHRKSILRLAFPMEDVKRYRQIVQEESSALLRDLGKGTPVDVADYSKKLPAAAISRYLGLGALPLEKLVEWTHNIDAGAVKNLFNFPALNEAAAASRDEIKPRMREILQQARDRLSVNSVSPKSSFIARFFDLFKTYQEPPAAEATPLDRYLMMQAVEQTYTTDEDIISSLLFLMTSCVDLTAGAITNIVAELMSRPDILPQAIAAAQKDNDDEFAQYVWEALRFRPSLAGFINTCAQDYTLGKGTDYEQTIKAGTQVYACTASAMHDPSVIEAPEEFRLGRPAHLAYTFFEAGLHTCHGKYFSMVQVPSAVKQLLRLGVPKNIDPIPVSQKYPSKPFRVKFSKT
ncbi:MAG: cytochrome P450 [Cyanobacteriota bacterium]|nr:cytochrome P450 [Cyanobacteriota bacterium]